MHTPPRGALIVLCCLAGGCFGMGANSPGESLTYAVRDFNNELRWGRYDAISPYLKPDFRDRFIEQLQNVDEDIEIVDQELTQISLRGADPDPSAPPPSRSRGGQHAGPGVKDKGTARVIWSWLSKRSGVLEKTTLRQSWTRVKDRWYLAKQERIAGPPLRPMEDPPLTSPPKKETDKQP